SLILFAIRSTCSFGCFFAFFLYGFSSLIFLYVTFTALAFLPIVLCSFLCSLLSLCFHWYILFYCSVYTSDILFVFSVFCPSVSPYNRRCSVLCTFSALICSICSSVIPNRYF